MWRYCLTGMLSFAVAEASATEWPEPQVAYEAVRILTQDDEEIMRMTVHHDRGRERQKIQSSEGEVIIVRPDLDAAFLILEGDTGIEMPLGEVGGSVTTYLRDLNPKEVGTETVGRAEATKYSFAGPTPMGGEFEGYAWVTEDGIVLRLVGTAELDGEQYATEMRLENVVKGPQDEALFAPPATTITMEEYVKQMSQE